MTAFFYVIIIAIIIYSIFSSPSVTVLANQSNSLNFSSISTGSNNLKFKIQNLISDSINDTDKIINSSTLLSNGSDLSSSNILISKNKVMSTVNSSGSDSSGSSVIKDQVTTINGNCNSIKVGGNGNDTIYSSGNCNDELTGGLGADKFTCSEGEDTIKDYNPKEGDTILDKQNCEKIQ